MNCTFPGPYVAVASQCVSGKNDKGGEAEKAIKNGFPLDYADEDVCL